ncbi:MAG: hypothetical protein H6835_12730 [Planctomycetes bacterium]|nr:hypothetical protein [Planctomycetota bacterium]
MNRLAFASLGLSLVGGLAAQSNTVPGLDGHLEILDNITYWGRRGPAYPGGQVGLSMRNTMCNPGSVSIPWYAAMQWDHPKFGFLITRLVGDRMEQVNEWSYCKHAFTSASTSGACGPCNGIGGTNMGVTCSDTYSAGNNASQYWLGPPEEINPWLGTWDPVGSYFDQGDPAVGSPANMDGNRSLTNGQISAFDDVKNRVTVLEQDLITPGATYFYAIQLIHAGEAVDNRWDNIKYRGFTPTWNGSTWSVANSGVGETFGSVLEAWPGATVNSGHNGNDDGRFFVGCKVTPLGGGSYHYEYAVHNVDNSRAGAALHIPIDASATASNFTFRDIDQDPLNGWIASRVGNEIVFGAPAGNPLEWNTIYNFGFDADFAPGSGLVFLDEARIGPGNLQVQVPASVPSVTTYASVVSYGAGCGGTAATCVESLYETPGFNLGNGSSFTLQYAPGSYTLMPGSGSWIAPAGTTLPAQDDQETAQALAHALPYPGGSVNQLFVCTNGFVSTASNGNSWTPLASDLIGGNTRWAPLWRDLSPNQGGSGGIRFDTNASRTVITWDAVQYYNSSSTARFQIQFWANGDVHYLYDTVATNGTFLVGFSMGNTSTDPGSTSIASSLNSGLMVCGNNGSTPDLLLTASARPVLGTTVDFTLTNAPAGTVLGVSILSATQVFPGVDLGGFGAPGCKLFVTMDDFGTFPIVGSSGTRSFTFPSAPALSGLQVTTQSATWTPSLNAFGFGTTNGLLMVTGVN